MARISLEFNNNIATLNQERTAKEWRPAYYISNSHCRDKKSSQNPYAVLILNQPISNAVVFSNVCFGAQYIVCADGGANRLRELQLNSAGLNVYNPDVICGDLDSISDDVKGYYQQQGTNIIKDSDQYSTDFTKCLKYISTKSDNITGKENEGHGQRSRTPCMDVAVIGGLCGRADQAFSQLHHLFSASEDSSLLRGDIYLVTPESVIFVLEKGLNIVHTPLSSDLLAENVGIIPLGRPSVITTRGLEWDVTDWATAIGGQISTSNHIRSGTIEVETSERVLFTVELAQKP